MIEVLRPGLQTTVQDPGRLGLRHLGVGQAGAADDQALRLANRLLGNPPGTAALECTLLGPTLRFTTASLVAIAGAGFELRLDGEPLRAGQPVRVAAGSRLEIGRCRHGARCYLAVRGGLLVEPLLGSRATDLGAGFGGLEGRSLQRGDRLRIGPAPGRPGPTAAWWAALPEDPQRALLPSEVLRLLPDADARLPADLTALCWQVDGRSSRKALRLAGPRLPVCAGAQRVSVPVAPGDIQVLPDGEPLLLGVEAPTVGGYPLLGRIIRADRHRIGQLRPGDEVRLLPVTLDAADAAWHRQEAAWQRLDLALARHGL